MTFEEWFEENFPCGYTKDSSKDALGMKKYLKQSWEASRENLTVDVTPNRFVSKGFNGVTLIEGPEPRKPLLNNRLVIKD